jgi:hypothetical protein
MSLGDRVEFIGVYASGLRQVRSPQTRFNVSAQDVVEFLPVSKP